MKLFSSLLMMRQNKLECLHLAKTLQSSLTLAGTSLPKKEASERCSNWVGFGLAFKFYDPTGKGYQVAANPLAYWALSSVMKENSL